METTQNTDTVVASSKYRSHTPKQCIAKGNHYSTRTKTNRLEKSGTKNILNGLQECTSLCARATQLQDRTERETNTKSGKNLSEEVIPGNLAKPEMTYEPRNINQKSFSTQL